MTDENVTVKLFLRVNRRSDASYLVLMQFPKGTVQGDLAGIITSRICACGSVTSVCYNGGAASVFGGGNPFGPVNTKDAIKNGDRFNVGLVCADIDIAKLKAAVVDTEETKEDMAKLLAAIAVSPSDVEVHFILHTHPSIFTERAFVMTFPKGTRYWEIREVIYRRLCKSGNMVISKIATFTHPDPKVELSVTLNDILYYDDERVITHEDVFCIDLIKCDIDVQELDSFTYSDRYLKFKQLTPLSPFPSNQTWIRERTPGYGGLLNIGQFHDKPGVFPASAYLSHGWKQPFRFNRAIFDDVYSKEDANQTIARIPHAASTAVYTLVPILAGLDSAVFDSLIFLANAKFNAAAPDLDLKIDLDLSDLEEHIPAEPLKEILRIYRQFSPIPAPITRCVLRRCAAVGKFIDFHTDAAFQTLQMALNDEGGESGYEGGRLVYLHNNLFDSPPRPKGTITVHGNNIVHGVTKLISGVRYSLYLF